jgi:hypothetical protein
MTDQTARACATRQRLATATPAGRPSRSRLPLPSPCAVMVATAWSSWLKTARASVSKVLPASVAITPVLPRSSSCTPSWRPSALTVGETADWVKCDLRAAAGRQPASTTGRRPASGATPWIHRTKRPCRRCRLGPSALYADDTEAPTVTGAGARVGIALGLAFGACAGG